MDPMYFACRHLDRVERDDWMNRGVFKSELTASYTIEAAYVMTIVLLALSSLIQLAYQIRRETVSAIYLQQAVEKVRYGEEELRIEEVQQSLNDRTGGAGADQNWKLGIDKKASDITAHGQVGNWKLVMEDEVFDPENWIRMITLLEQKKEGDT